MDYFIRQDADSIVTGPFSVCELMSKIETGQITSTWLASSNIGDDLERIQKFRKSDWFQISKIPQQDGNITANSSSEMIPIKSPLRCIRCETEMESGFITDSTYGGTVVSNWIPGPPERSFWTGTRTVGKERYAISTYRCPKCGYLESYARD